jgi:ferredoxin-thioredoxin reductase catalytic subunit
MMEIIRNPDQEFAKEIKRRIKDNNGYCPCAYEKTKDTKCKCKAFRDQVSKGIPGECECGLYIAIKDDE